MRGWTRRRVLLAGLSGVAAVGVGTCLARWRRGAPVGLRLRDEELDRAHALLARHAAVDVHAHPGRTFVRGAEHLPWKVWAYAKVGTFEDRAVSDMLAGGLAAAAFATVSDFQTLDLTRAGLRAVREFEPGEALESHRRQLAHLHSLAQRGLVHPVLEPDDIERARAASRPGAIFAAEGGDFLEGRAERVADAQADGLRIITIVHYRTNELGDTMTEPPTHGGLTPAGAEVVREMNRLGLVVDLAHASEATAYGALEVSSQPVMLSHTHVRTERLSVKRFVSKDLARAVAQGGGLVGAWPAGFGISDLAGFVDRTLELVETVGIGHVGLGTDMDANYRPVLDSYRKLPLYAAGLLQRGLSDGDVARILGGNFRRLFAQVRSAAEAAGRAAAPAAALAPPTTAQAAGVARCGKGLTARRRQAKLMTIARSG